MTCVGAIPSEHILLLYKFVDITCNVASRRTGNPLQHELTTLAPLRQAQAC